MTVMADREQITQPSLGSNELGTETDDTHLTGASAGSDTQPHLAGKSKKYKKNKNINDDEKVVKNPYSENKFLQAGETDE